MILHASMEPGNIMGDFIEPDYCQDDSMEFT